jgi:hypothetical protein
LFEFKNSGFSGLTAMAARIFRYRLPSPENPGLTAPAPVVCMDFSGFGADWFGFLG